MKFLFFQTGRYYRGSSHRLQEDSPSQVEGQASTNCKWGKTTNEKIDQAFKLSWQFHKIGLSQNLYLNLERENPLNTKYNISSFLRVRTFLV
jgi:hypothetical protein